MVWHPRVNTAISIPSAPSEADTKATTRVLPRCALVGLHSAVSPTPLTPNRKGHVGLDLDPIRPRAQNCRRAQVDRKGGAVLHPRLISRAENLRARKTGIVGVDENIKTVDENIKTVGRARSVKIHSIGVNRLHIPSLTCRHDKVVGQISVEFRKVGERSREGGIGSGIVILVIEDHLRSFRRSRNRDYVRCTNATDLLRKLRYARQVGNPANIIGKKLRASLRLRSSFRVNARSGSNRPSGQLRHIWVARRISHAPLGSPATAGLCQCKGDGAHGHKQKQIKCASNKMRFDGGINLLFHFGVVAGTPPFSGFNA